MIAELVPPRDSHCTVSVLSPLLILPPSSSTGRLQAELQTRLPRTWPLRPPAAGSHPSTLELEAVIPAPSKFLHSQKYRSSKGRQVSLRSPSAQVILSPPTKSSKLGARDCTDGAPSPSTGRYMGHHLGTVKDRTQQGSSAVVQTSETLHMPHLPRPSSSTQYRNVKTG